MRKALKHAFEEGAQAAAFAADRASALRMRTDFLLSRLLKWGWWPGYNRGRRVQVGGVAVSYRFNRGDLQSLREVLIEEVYACELPFAPCSLLDLGANIGLWSLWMAARASEARKPHILAVEPLGANARVAEVNFQANALPGKVLQAAVGRRTGEAWFEARAESNLGRVVDANDGADRIRVPVIGIDDLLARFPEGRVDVVKMDIEGAEAELLAEDASWLSRVEALMVEWHEDRADPAPLIRNVEAAGFQHQRLNVRRQDNLSLFLRNQP